MKLKLFIMLIVALFIFGCSGTKEPPKTQLQIREFQTRSYQTHDIKMVLKAMLNVLQDEGFIIKNASVDLGLISATKEVDIEKPGEALMTALFSGPQGRWKKSSVIECSGNITEFGEETRVRINFQKKELNNHGEVINVKQVDDAKFYEEFFSKVDKGIFLQKEKLG